MKQGHNGVTLRLTLLQLWRLILCELKSHVFHNLLDTGYWILDINLIWFPQQRFLPYHETM